MSEDKKDNSPSITEELIRWLNLDSLPQGDIVDSKDPKVELSINELEKELAMTTDEDERKKIESKIKALEMKSERASTPMRITGDK